MHTCGLMRLIFSVRLKSHNMCLALGITDFISRGIQAVSKFELIANQIQKNERDIESKLQSMVTANLMKFPVPDKSDDLPGRTNKRILIIGYNNYIISITLVFIDSIVCVFSRCQGVL